ncbi:MAG TPA: hypothetical protein VNN07_06840, partial [Candidatus Tectomicrobia bacterium]|nr:hypothetical protein [Candidatus Tectomicrobia bacterium]
MRQAIAGAALLVLASVAAAGATPVLEVTHHAHGHDVHVSAPAVAVLPDGTPIVAWAAREGDRKLVRLARPGSGQPAVAVTPDGLEVDALHQAPGLAIGPDGEVYVSWSSSKPKPPGTLFASDLRLSRSLDGGRTFDHHLRVNEDRPISHAFEGIAVAGDGAVIASWIDARDGGRPATWAARVVERGSRVEHAVQLDPGETCVCCRVSVAAGPDRTVAVAWRGVLPGQVRDMLVALSRDGGRTFARPSLVHADGWKITACPHRGGRLAIDGAGRLYAAWYTEGPRERPDVLF